MNYIAGEWVESSTGETFEDRNPADTREVVAIFQKSGKADVDAAVEAAKQAFERWRLVPAPRRAEIVFRAAEMLAERKEEYSRDMTREMGKVIKETRGDTQEAIDTAYYMAGEGRRLFGPTTPSELPNKFAMAIRQPVGVCGMITPWNFPMAIPSWKLLPAIVCGNTCVIKPAQDTPLSTFNLVRTLADAGVPNGVINIVTGFGASVGSPLTEHEDVRAISLTGSTAVGRVVGTTAAKSFKHCSLELGGKNPMMVLDDANLELAIEGGLWGAFGTTGQRCTATSRIIVQKRVYREFVERYVARAKALKVGNGLDESVDMGPAVNEAQLNTDLSYVDIGKDEGAKLVCGGNRLDRGAYQYGYFMEPTVFIDVDPKMRIAQEEIFGPVVSIIPCDNLEHGIVSPSAGPKPRAMDTARAGSGRSTSIPSGSRCISIIRTSCRRHRSIGRTEIGSSDASRRAQASFFLRARGLLPLALPGRGFRRRSAKGSATTSGSRTTMFAVVLCARCG